MSPAARLVAALNATLTALEAGDVVLAGAALQAVNAACAGLGPDGLDAAELEAARELHARCVAAADRRQDHVVAELLQSATHQKATHAYGSTS